MVPTMFRQLLALPASTRAAADLRQLRLVAHGGEPCPPVLKARMIEWLGPILVEYFGFTEGGMTVATTEEWQARPGTVGRPMSAQEIWILDDEGNRLPPRQEGRIFFGPQSGPGGATFRYRNDDDKTAQAHVGNLFTAGDIGWLDEDGYLFVSGRVSDVIVSAGVNVYPSEIEAVLATVRGIAEAAVVGAPDDVRGESPAAFVVVAEGSDADATLDAARAACEERLAGYQHPRLLLVRPSLPRDATGKLLRDPLRAELWHDQPAFAAAAPDSGASE
jgi:long-chain acyl-CoA synthetase